MNERQSTSPLEFWSTFRGVLEPAIANGPSWREAWRAGGGPWSKWIFPYLKKVFLQLGYGEAQVEQEKHGRIDFTLVAGSDQDNSPGLDKAEVEIAIEHENNPSEWNYEWRKLQRFKLARLRVVIGYSKPSRLPTDVAEAEQVMTSATDLDDKPYLLIVGPVNGMPGETFQAWQWDNGRLEKLPGKIVLP